MIALKIILAAPPFVCYVVYVLFAWTMRAILLRLPSHLDFKTHYCRFFILISSDNVFEDPDAATDALQRHREAKKLKV